MSPQLLVEPKPCGAGEYRCCAYLLVGPAGFECGRVTGLRAAIVSRVADMRARRLPEKPYPECQAEETYPPGLRPKELDA